MKKNKKQEMNYLDLIPEKDKNLEWYVDEKEMVVLKVENKGFYNRIAQRFFHRPKYMNVHLDAQGSYIWPQIDGKKTVEELAKLQKEHFGEEAEPLYERIIKYLQILEGRHFIQFNNYSDSGKIS